MPPNSDQWSVFTALAKLFEYSHGNNDTQALRLTSLFVSSLAPRAHERAAAFEKGATHTHAHTRARAHKVMNFLHAGYAQWDNPEASRGAASTACHQPGVVPLQTTLPISRTICSSPGRYQKEEECRFLFLLPVLRTRPAILCGGGKKLWEMIPLKILVAAVRLDVCWCSLKRSLPLRCIFRSILFCNCLANC